MKRSELKRGKGPTRSAPKRDWSAARVKMGAEGVCRVCGRPDGLEAAHTIARDKQDDQLNRVDGRLLPPGWLWVNPDSIIPLCKTHHEAFDSRRLDILPFLSLAEQLNAVEAAEGMENARKRLCPSAYRAELR